MLSLLTIIPLSVFAGIFLVLSGQESDGEWRYSWVGSFVLAAIFWGVIVVASAELLTLIRAINRVGLSLSWIAVGILLIIIGIRSSAFQRAIGRVKSVDRSYEKFEWFLLGSLGFVAAILFLIAVIAPPNNVDSFLYHMSRVVHWAQNESLEHYPTYRDHQLNKPIWAEAAILHLRVLWGSDRPANLIQWFSMVGSVLGVAGITALIGAKRSGQLAAAVFAVTIPMGILQATSTQNDYVTAFWVVCMAYLVVQSIHRPLTSTEYLGLASVFGLGILTKGVFFVYFPPLLLWYFLNMLRRKGLLRTFASGMTMLVIALVLNLGFWARNVQTYGGPYGTSDWLQRNLGFNVEFFNRLFESDQEAQSSGGMQLRRPPVIRSVAQDGRLDAFGISRVSGSSTSDWGVVSPQPQPDFYHSYLSQLARTLGRNFTSPSGFITTGLVRFVDSAPEVFGEAYGDQLRASAWNHEDHAGNLHHLLLIVIMLVLLPIVARRWREWLSLLYGVVVTLTYLLLPIVIGHAESFWGIRYQLPFFVLAAPIFGYLISRLEIRWLQVLFTVGLLVAAIPWILLNNTRPIIGMPPWPTKIESIFVADQGQILMANNPALRDDYELSTDAVRASGCRQVGLIVDQSFLEYAFWWFLDGPQSGIEIRIIVSEEDDYPSVVEDFQPCTVVCTHCQDETSMRGLTERERFDTLTLFR